MIEEWKPIKQYEGIYEVSNLGRVRSVDRFDTNGHHLRSVVLKPHYNKKRICTSFLVCWQSFKIYANTSLSCTDIYS
ncbi:NUMOD4 domain-containing protein [Lacticaseibacillus pantheris]|uniref:NUMOD4 domain-containing protein n=1 Tax=Lacticaseibacillus pantheris TaxID=171523 RepID=UPI0009E8EE3B